MATRSTISKLNPDGTYTTIYCHWDGYPEHVGKMLYMHYNTEERVDELLSLGDISSLHPLVAPPDGVNHTFDNPYPDVTVAYHRDRGEEFHITHSLSISEIKGKFGQEWNYLWKNGKWYYSNHKLNFEELKIFFKSRYNE